MLFRFYYLKTTNRSISFHVLPIERQILFDIALFLYVRISLGLVFAPYNNSGW